MADSIFCDDQDVLHVARNTLNVMRGGQNAADVTDWI